MYRTTFTYSIELINHPIKRLSFIHKKPNLAARFGLISIASEDSGKITNNFLPQYYLHHGDSSLNRAP